MEATVYKSKRLSERDTTITLVQGFTGKLKGCQDNLCTQEDRELILKSVKIETNESDAMSTLICSIIQNFVGDCNIFKDRATNQLNNLRWPTMSNYRWYKDTFLSKVALREDGFAGFWKEKFIAGLSKLFAEKFRTNLQQFYENPNFEKLRYDQIHNIIIITGIQVCTDFKLQDKIHKEKLTNRREVGTFCQRYGIKQIRAPSTQLKKRNKQNKKLYTPKKPYRKSYKKNPNQEP